MFEKKYQAVLDCNVFPKEISQLINEFCDHENKIEKLKTIHTIIDYGYNSWLQYFGEGESEYNCKQRIYSLRIFPGPARFNDWTYSCTRVLLEYRINRVESSMFFAILRAAEMEVCDINLE